MLPAPHSSSSAANVVELHYENHQGRVKVVGDSSSVMLLPMEDAIAACRAHKEQVRFIDQFKRLADELAQWVMAHREKIKQAFLTTRDAGLLFVVERNEQAFDETLEDELINLDLRIARDEQFSLIKLSVQPLPACSEAAIKSFLTPGKTIQIKIHG